MQEYLTAVGDYARDHPERPWISGGGWSLESFPGGLPTAAALDAVVPDRPVFLPNRDHHGAWVNTRALELAGITRDTPDPVSGRIERDARGEPTGMLQEGAIGLVGVAAARRLGGRIGRALSTGPRRCLHSLGITGWQDAMVGAGLGGPDNFDAYRRAAESGTAHCPGARRPVVGARPRRRADRPRRSPEDRRAAGTAGSTPAPSRSCRTASSRTAPPPCSPYSWTAAWARRRSPARRQHQRHELHRSGQARPVRDRARPPRLPGALPRARRPSRARGTRRRRGGAGRQRPARQPAPPRPPAGRVPAGRGAVRRRSAPPPTSSRCGRATNRRWTSSPSRC